LAQSPSLVAEGGDPDAFRQTARVWLCVAIGFALALPVDHAGVYLAFAIWLIWAFTAIWVMRRPGPPKGTRSSAA
jgi:hypothetical protein